MTAIHGFRDYCIPVKEKPAAIPPPPDIPRAEPIPTATAPIGFDDVFDAAPDGLWVRLVRLWRR